MKDSEKEADQERATAILAAAGGAAAGAVVPSVIGGMGLTVGGTAVAIGMAPLAAAGVVIGLAGYGLSKLFK